MKKEADIVRKREVKAILFDLDGVLVDSLDAWFYVFNDALRHFGFNKMTKSDFVKDFGAPIEHDVQKYFKGKTIEEVVNAYNINFQKNAKYIKLNPQSKSILDKIKKQKIKLGLITNSSKSIASKVLNHFKLNKYFYVIMTLEDVKRRKPAPDMILKACRMLKVTPKSTILVGDTKNDIIAGRRAGCVTVGYKIKGDYKINDLKEIERFIYV